MGAFGLVPCGLGVAYDLLVDSNLVVAFIEDILEVACGLGEACDLEEACGLEEACDLEGACDLEEAFPEVDNSLGVAFARDNLVVAFIMGSLEEAFIKDILVVASARDSLEEASAKGTREEASVTDSLAEEHTTIEEDTAVVVVGNQEEGSLPYFKIIILH